jgi:dihydrofolate reductase
VLADGGSARSFADTLEPAILAGTVPPVLVVGAHNAVDPANLGADRRAQEYLFGASIGRQCIESGLVDELLIHLVPVLLGDGLRLFDKPGSKQVPLERLSRGQSATPR